MRLDLHVHTTASDGSLTPEEMVRAAVAGGLDVLAVADHDTVAGVAPAEAEIARAGLPLHLVPALEVSSTRPDGRELHVLGYFVDPEAPSIRDHQARALARRTGRMAGMVERLQAQGVQVEMEAVLEAAGPRRNMIARPHLAAALVAGGWADDIPDAFDRWISDDHDAFIPTGLGPTEDAVRVVTDAGGVAVWAHPPLDLVDAALPGLVDAGLGGIEVYRPATSAQQARRLRRLAKRHGLVVTGGSDWHSAERNRPLGEFAVDADEVAELLTLGGL